MKLLVTGGAGFIGSNFIRYWLNEYPDDSIVNLDNLTYAGNLENLVDLENSSSYSLVRGDICDPGLVNDVMQMTDMVVHFAAESHVDRSIKDASDFIRTNVEGTRVLLDAALKNGKKRFHHVSTDEVYGSLALMDAKFNERTAYDPRSPYSASKAASDHLVRAYFHTHGLPITISNCSNNYGPYQFPEKLIPLFVTNILEGKILPLYGQGENIRDWIHVDDHNRGVDFIIQKGRIGETYCLGANSEKTNKEIADAIISQMGASRDIIKYVNDRPGHDLRYAIDFTKANTELGWEPLISFEEGLASLIKWYTENTAWWKKIKSGDYQSYYKDHYGEQV
jgi:dTDP-glucose 4,6-dehydratase